MEHLYKTDDIGTLAASANPLSQGLRILQLSPCAGRR